MKKDDRPVVCQVLHSLSVGGAEVLAREFAVNAASQFKTVFLCLDSIGEIGEGLIREGFTVECFGRKPGLDRSLISKTGKFFAEQNVQLIHAHQYTPFVYASLGRMRRRGLRLWNSYPPILMTEHGRHYPDIRKPKRVLANKFLFRKQDRCVAVGEQVKKALIENEGLSPARIDVIYNGVDVDQFQKSATDRCAARAELGLSDQDVAVFQIARLNALKDHATAIDAWHFLNNDPHIHLFIIGDGELADDVRQQISALSLQDQVHMLGVRHDVPRIIHAADILLLTSVSEGIPLTLIEAMAASLPCVATIAGGIPEVIINQETGLLAPIGDASKVADCMRTLSQDAAMRTSFGRAGRERAESVFSAAKMHNSYHQAYRKMIAGSTTSQSKVTE
ncbi:N-acetylgalactosamine-N,N'-diacetylbacillosaminyl-diphospho-undecaprenol 4-alpha-N-acetylgalactosaminyltransferase [Rubripirellula obstinata]|uniref:N-acetylgalactosamine-N, N'-diacetylbacillosaminyl-diphospho-undecaprenol 4-alpha-N-acetylgalactosaminyltransferase n=1 Tax=Rubripirellula obstinata TaxID=406547 RepID=A0A5B1CN58_9BACT|nr:glycosyltransferase [Rubripirellula obstinata]KAA1261010.1 N-acetylgalactosamine-N,N'-diacetylbacillosaminyl-diphospho-undecaprenol 4-alpha-N-acetylgalactosaminyltransferase [Rubripirellula obstinata]